MFLRCKSDGRRFIFKGLDLGQVALQERVKNALCAAGVGSGGRVLCKHGMRERTSSPPYTLINTSVRMLGWAFTI